MFKHMQFKSRIKQKNVGARSRNAIYENYVKHI